MTPGLSPSVRLARRHCSREDQASRTLEALRDVRFVELPGDHITSMFGEPAGIAAVAIVEFVTVEV